MSGCYRPGHSYQTSTPAGPASRPGGAQAGRLASIASTTSGASGSVAGRNRATTLPSGLTRNFSKFHWMSPASPSASASGGQLGVERVPARPVDVDLGEHRERDAVVRRAELGDLLGACPAPGRRTGCTGNPTTVKPRSANRSCSRCRPAYWGVSPHFDATLTTSSVLPARSPSDADWPSRVLRGMSCRLNVQAPLAFGRGGLTAHVNVARGAGMPGHPAEMPSRRPRPRRRDSRPARPGSRGRPW